MVGRLERDRAPFGADAGVDHGDVNRPRRKAPPGAVQEERALQHSERPHAVGDVDHRRLCVDR